MDSFGAVFLSCVFFFYVEGWWVERKGRKTNPLDQVFYIIIGLSLVLHVFMYWLNGKKRKVYRKLVCIGKWKWNLRFEDGLYKDTCNLQPNSLSVNSWSCNHNLFLKCWALPGSRLSRIFCFPLFHVHTIYSKHWSDKTRHLKLSPGPWNCDEHFQYKCSTVCNILNIGRLINNNDNNFSGLLVGVYLIVYAHFTLLCTKSNITERHVCINNWIQH